MNRNSEDIAAIRKLAEDWRAGWLTGDVDALLALFTDDPVVMPWGQPVVRGKEAIRPLYKMVFKDYAIRSETTLAEVEVSGDLGYFWAGYKLRATPKAGGEAIEEEGKSLFIVRRERGSWKIARLMDNSDHVPEGS